MNEPAQQTTKLTEADAKVILAADSKNRQNTDKSLVEKVAEGRVLSDDERGAMESRIADAEAVQISTATVAAARKGKGRHKHSRPGAHDLAVAGRRRLVFEHRTRHPATPIREIAKILGCTTSTVMKDIHALRTQHQEIFDPAGNMELLNRSIESFDLLAGKALRLADSYSSPAARTGLLRISTQALEAKARLLLDTGVVRKAPVQHRIGGPSGGPIPIHTTSTAGPGPTVQELADALMAALQPVTAPGTTVAPEPAPEPTVQGSEAPKPGN